MSLKVKVVGVIIALAIILLVWNWAYVNLPREETKIFQANSEIEKIAQKNNITLGNATDFSKDGGKMFKNVEDFFRAIKAECGPNPIIYVGYHQPIDWPPLGIPVVNEEEVLKEYRAEPCSEVVKFVYRYHAEGYEYQGVTYTNGMGDLAFKGRSSDQKEKYQNIILGALLVTVIVIFSLVLLWPKKNS